MKWLILKSLNFDRLVSYTLLLEDPVNFIEGSSSLFLVSKVKFSY